WLQTVERIFDLRDIPDRLKVKLVAIKLKKYASLWWEQVQTQRARKGKHKVDTWDKMKRLLRDQFLPVTNKQDVYLDYQNLKQASLSVEELINEFERMRMRCGAEEHEEQIIARFLVIVEANPTPGALPTEVLPLVNDFFDIFPDDIPAGLPLMREIQHCIDFILGASIPKRPAYRMNPRVRGTTTSSY
nr:reverse transcriptase domain-containing protein [Tanacetum cinerariifolium]